MMLPAVEVEGNKNAGIEKRVSQSPKYMETGKAEKRHAKESEQDGCDQ